jgi:cytochrome c
MVNINPLFYLKRSFQLVGSILGAMTAKFDSIPKMELNKIAASVLLAGIVAMISGFAADVLYRGGELPETRGYTIEGVDLAAAAGSAPKEVIEQIALFLPEASAAKGEGLFRACASCHSIEKGGANKVGPNLYGVLGADIAGDASFGYSAALQEKEGEWTWQDMSQFLKKPKKWAPGTAMSYIGMKKPEDRASLLLYINSMSDTPLPLPEPPAEETQGEEGADEAPEEAAEASAADGEPEENDKSEADKRKTDLDLKPANEELDEPIEKPGDPAYGNAVEDDGTQTPDAAIGKYFKEETGELREDKFERDEAIEVP